jgi:hypothetical protein
MITQEANQCHSLGYFISVPAQVVDRKALSWESSAHRSYQKHVFYQVNLLQK